MACLPKGEQTVNLTNLPLVTTSKVVLYNTLVIAVVVIVPMLKNMFIRSNYSCCKNKFGDPNSLLEVGAIHIYFNSFSWTAS